MADNAMSGYSIVVHEVTTNSVKLGVGALSPAMGKPNNWHLIISESDNRTTKINSNAWHARKFNHKTALPKKITNFNVETISLN